MNAIRLQIVLPTKSAILIAVTVGVVGCANLWIPGARVTLIVEKTRSARCTAATVGVMEIVWIIPLQVVSQTPTVVMASIALLSAFLAVSVLATGYVLVEQMIHVIPMRIASKDRPAIFIVAMAGAKALAVDRIIFELAGFSSVLACRFGHISM